LLKLGFDVSERTVSRLMPQRPKPFSQSWRTFLDNHLGSTIAVNFFAVPTLSCRLLFVFVVLAHDRRRILHVNLTRNPTSAWTCQQLRESFPDDATARFLLHDGDATFDAAFGRTAEAFGLTSVRTAHARPGRIPMSNASSGPSVASVWTTSLSSTSDISGECFDPTSRTTSALERTSRSARTRPRHALAIRSAPDGSWRGPKSAGSTIATNGKPPESASASRDRRQEPERRGLPLGCSRGASGKCGLACRPQ
jgi:hypothetical protein